MNSKAKTVLGWTTMDESKKVSFDNMYYSRATARNFSSNKIVKIRDTKPDDKHLVTKAWGVFSKVNNKLLDICENREKARDLRRNIGDASIKPVFFDSSK